jgi:hypothetical protein
MATRIEERFTVKAGPDAVWAFLVDPTRVVTCLPGAELTEVVDERHFRGAVKVKVGPVTVGYQGCIELVELERPAWRVKMAGEGRESGGAGSARMSMESKLTPLSDGATEVLVTSDVDVVGRLVQLGRGMIEQVSHQLFLEFAERVRAALEAEAGTASGAAPPPRPEALAALPLLLRALWAWLKGLFGRGPARR